MTIEERKVLVKPSGKLDTIELEDGHPEKTTKIGANLPPKIKESPSNFLRTIWTSSHGAMKTCQVSILPLSLIN
jgi:hypothetical protein